MLLLAVGEDVELVALQLIVAHGALQQFHVLMEQGLANGVECDGYILLSTLLSPLSSLPFPLSTLLSPLSSKNDVPELRQLLLKLRRTGQLQLASHVVHQLLSFHLRSGLQSFGNSLRRETFLVDALHGVGDEGKVLRHQYAIVGQHLQERHLLGLGSRQFGHNLHRLATFLRQLVLHLERSDGVDFIAEEVDAERQLMTEAVDVEDASAHGKLTGLVDVVFFVESQLA